ncbi:nucleotidyltransferase domain-containing protein [bacterium]|nr:nucleotidyltransferase domain-containing protein [bacterium]
MAGRPRRVCRFDPYISYMNDFKEHVRAKLVSNLEVSNQTLAAWEGGSAANGTSDAYSDIDLVVVGKNSVEAIFEVIEVALGHVSPISHKYEEPKCFWPGCYQRVYFLEGAPKHFFVDIAVFLETSTQVLSEFMQPERHGNPVVHFDKVGLVKPRSSDPVALKSQHFKRIEEIEAAYPIFKLEVLKALDREHSIDAYCCMLKMLRLCVLA